MLSSAFESATGPSNESPHAAHWRARRCVVTGSGGFIGSALCQRLRGLGAEVHGFARASITDAPVDRHHVCDVTDQARVRELLVSVRPDVVFHMAAKVTGARERELVLPTLHDNLLGTVYVLLAAAEAGSDRIICLGSLQEPDNELLAAPCSPYAAAKFAASAYLRMFAQVFDIPATIVRPFMVYGPGQTDLTKFVPYVLSQLFHGRVAELSSGKQEFDWVYVDDVVDALISTATRSDLSGRTIDVGWGALTSVREVARGLADRVGTPDLLRLGAIADRRLEPTRYANVKLTESAIGWAPRVSLEDGLDRAVAWYRRWFASQARRESGEQLGGR